MSSFIVKLKKIKKKLNCMVIQPNICILEMSNSMWSVLLGRNFARWLGSLTPHIPASLVSCFSFLSHPPNSPPDSSSDPPDLIHISLPSCPSMLNLHLSSWFWRSPPRSTPVCWVPCSPYPVSFLPWPGMACSSPSWRTSARGKPP